MERIEQIDAYRRGPLPLQSATLYSVGRVQPSRRRIESHPFPESATEVILRLGAVASASDLGTFVEAPPAGGSTRLEASREGPLLLGLYGS